MIRYTLFNFTQSKHVKNFSYFDIPRVRNSFYINIFYAFIKNKTHLESIHKAKKNSIDFDLFNIEYPF